MTVQARRRVDVGRTLARFPVLAGTACEWRPLAGGLSHHIYLVETGAAPLTSGAVVGSAGVGGAGVGGAGLGGELRRGAGSPPRQVVLRVLEPAVSAAGLGIAPADEIANTRLAVHSGVGAAVLDALDDPPAVLLEYLDGQTLS